MYRVTLKRTNETEDFETYFDADMFIRMAVMFHNERLKIGLEKGKRDNRRNYVIEEI